MKEYHISFFITFFAFFMVLSATFLQQYINSNSHIDYINKIEHDSNLTMSYEQILKFDAEKVQALSDYNTNPLMLKLMYYFLVCAFICLLFIAVNYKQLPRFNKNSTIEPSYILKIVNYLWLELKKELHTSSNTPPQDLKNQLPIARI